ncbi:TnsD family Tn7-like transposition protein [Psychrobacillus sp. NPDC096623]|uniref:TnsD family Tn7-like transposition protein n=1 Tax=Psychrobacillus sp. NPDC096623 TaxID=3364492 RepID=UPI0037F7893C
MWEIKMDLFPYAKKLETKLEHFNFYKASEILESFSFLNYYNKFLSYDNKNKLRNLMLDERSGWIRKEIYCHEIETYNNDYYKFCLKCFEEDSVSGVPYWHITHNLPGVTYCERHKCKLVVSNVLFNGKELVALSSQVKKSVPPLLSDKEEKILKLIAEQTDYLFHTKEDISKYIPLYISYLYDMGYLNGFKINEKKLKKHFNNFFSNNICEVLNIEKEFVISKIIETISSSIKELHPLFHILFIIFCGRKIEDLDKSNLILTPFNSELLHKTCRCFDGIYIHNSSLRFRNKGLVGSYQCSSCGNAYNINSWDKKISVSYGSSFSEQVLELLFIEDLSISDICYKLNINVTELKNHLIFK